MSLIGKTLLFKENFNASNISQGKTNFDKLYFMQLLYIKFNDASGKLSKTDKNCFNVSAINQSFYYFKKNYSFVLKVKV